MSYTGQISRRQRAISATAAVVAVVAVAVALSNGFDIAVMRKASEAISTIALSAPTPPESIVVPARQPADVAAGKASAANRRGRAAPAVVPKARLLPPDPPRIVAAHAPGIGSDTAAGAAPIAGPGNGAGGRGDGLGAGDAGSGGGGGSRAAWRSGAIRDRDYPVAARRAKIGGAVEVRFTVEPTGRVSGCRVTRSSGNADLDATTCRLVEARFRFKPATDAAGRPIASSYGWRQSWWLERR